MGGARSVALNEPALIAQPLRCSQPLARETRWRRLAAAQEFDPEAQMIGAGEAAATPEAAVRLRLAILLETYAGDYATAAFDVDAIAARIGAGGERIFFWGDPEAVAAARKLLRARGLRDGGAVPRLGTATVIDASGELGPGHAEMCRTGSTCGSVAAAVPIALDLLELFDGAGGQPLGRAHTLASVPRNRPSSATVRGGAAIHRIHVRTLGSSFWGLAPWYRMQEGVLEVLDFREIYADPAAQLEAIRAMPPALLASAEDAELVALLLRLNLDESPMPAAVLHVERPADAPAPAGRWAVLPLAEGDLAAANPVFVHPHPEGAHRSLSAALAAAEALPHCCVVARLALDHARLAGQRDLAARGYQLGAVSPPKPGAGPRGMTGLWSRPDAALPLALPYYLTRRAARPVERELLGQLGRLAAAWEGARL